MTGIKLRIANSSEDREYWMASPSGAVEVYTTNAAVMNDFVPGHKYRVTFEDVTEPLRPPAPAPVAPAPPPVEPDHGE